MYRDENQRDFARKLRHEMTDAERLLWRSLRSEQLADRKFRRQAAIGDYIVDFVCFDARLVIELDGGQHNEREHRDYDERRTAWLESQGYTVLRYWNFQVMEYRDGVLEAIWDGLGESSDGASPIP